MCPATTGSITVTATGGTDLFTYSIDGGTTYQQSPAFTGLPAGTYDIWVKDSNECTHQYGPLTIKQLPCGECIPKNKLVFIRSLQHGAPVQSVAWLCPQNDECPRLAAIGGYKACNDNDDYCTCASVRAYTFDIATTQLIAVPFSPSALPTDYVYSVDWCCIDGTPYLAVAGCPDELGNSVWIYQYTGTQMTLVQSFKHNGTIYSAKWLCDACNSSTTRYLAIGGDPVSKIDTRLLVFDTAGSLYSIVDHSHGATVYTVDWCIRNNQCPLLATGGKTVNSCNEQSNIRLYAVSCSGTMSLISSAHFESSTVRTLSWCCDADTISKKFPYLLVGGDPRPDGMNTGSDAAVYYYNFYTQELKPLAFTTQPEKVFASTWIPGCDCKLLALGSGCIFYDQCEPNIQLFSVECKQIAQLIKKGSKKFDDNITSLASCKVGSITFVLAGSESNSWNLQETDPLCNTQLKKNEIALYGRYFLHKYYCTVYTSTCMWT